MRILFVRTRYHSNQHYAMKSLVDRGHEVRCLVRYFGPSEDHTLLQPRRIPEYRLLERLVRGGNKEEAVGELMTKLYSPSILQIYREFRRFDPDVVVLKQGASPMLIRAASLAAMMQGTPRVSCDQRPLMFKKRKRSLKSQLRHPGRLLILRPGVSFTNLAGVFTSEKPVKLGKTYVIPLVVEFPGDRPKPAAIAAGPVRILGVGNYLLPRKNHALLLAAVAKVATFHDVALTLVGSGNPNDGRVAQLRRLACELGIEDKVSLVSNVPNAEMPDVYARHDLFVLPSSNEPCGYTVLEAMAAGLPVIASDSCGSREYFDEDINGRVFASDDLNSLVAAIESIVRDRGVMRAMGEASMRIAQERYAPHVYHDRLMDLLWNEFGLGEDPRGNTIDTVNVAPALKEPTRVGVERKQESAVNPN